MISKTGTRIPCNNLIMLLKTGLGYKRPYRYTCVILSLTAEVLINTRNLIGCQFQASGTDKMIDRYYLSWLFIASNYDTWSVL